MNSPLLQPLYELHGERGLLFRGADRLKLLLSALTSHAHGCCGLDLELLTSQGCILTYYCLHSDAEIRELRKQWLRLSAPSAQPFDR